MEIEYKYENNYITKNDNIYRKNGLLIAKVIKLYQCVDCVHIFNTIAESDTHYKQFHQNCISSTAYHKNYGKNRNKIVSNLNQNSAKNTEIENDLKSFEEINCGKLLKTYSKKKFNFDNQLLANSLDGNEVFGNECVEEVVESSDERFKDRKPMEYKCDFCELSFRTKSKLSLHENLHLFPKICDYPYCEEKFAMDYELQAHYRTCHESHEKQLFKCDLCDKCYATEAETRLHRKIHTDPKICDFPNCGKKFSCNSILKKHQQIHDKSQVFKCDKCDKKFPQLVRLNIHKKLHTNPIVCDFEGCGKLFASKCFLKLHRFIHYEDKPHSCQWPGCDFVSKHPQSVISHQKTHNNERPHRCQWTRCGQGFKSAAALRRHISCKHKHEKNFCCDWKDCGKKFAYKETLINHYRTHTGERPFACDWPECGKRFTYKDGLHRHRLTHTGERPYACDFEGCGARLTTSGSLNTHKKLVHKCDYIKRSHLDKKKKKTSHLKEEQN